MLLRYVPQTITEQWLQTPFINEFEFWTVSKKYIPSESTCLWFWTNDEFLELQQFCVIKGYIHPSSFALLTNYAETQNKLFANIRRVSPLLKICHLCFDVLIANDHVATFRRLFLFLQQEEWFRVENQTLFLQKACLCGAFRIVTYIVTELMQQENVNFSTQACFLLLVSNNHVALLRNLHSFFKNLHVSRQYLFHACEKNYFELLQFLLPWQTKLTKTNCILRDMFRIACKKNHYEIIELLLRNINNRYSNVKPLLNTGFNYALMQNQPKTLNMILSFYQPNDRPRVRKLVLFELKQMRFLPLLRSLMQRDIISMHTLSEFFKHRFKLFVHDLEHVHLFMELGIISLESTVFNHTEIFQTASASPLSIHKEFILAFYLHHKRQRIN